MPLHPQSKAFLAMIREANRPAWYELPLEVARQTFNDLGVFGDRPNVDNVSDLNIGGVPTRIFHVDASNPRDVIVFFHGGGWVLGGLDSHDPFCRRLALAADATVVSVDYRQPPENPYPAALEDCFTVCDVLSLDYQSLSLGGRMVLAGDSAGGNLAAAVSLMARDRGGPSLAGQVLVYPVLDGSMSTESHRVLAEDHGLTADVMAWFWDSYTGTGPESSRSSPLASPVAAELSGLPPTHILLAEYDVLRDEGQKFAERLMVAGVPTTVNQYDGMLHGFVHFAELFDDSARALEEVATRCREMLDNLSSPVKEP